MSRVKLTEFKSKQLLYRGLRIPYYGIASLIDEKGALTFSTPLTSLSSKKEYTVKVDQGVKRRMKKGLVKLSIHKNQLVKNIEKLARKSYVRFLIEEMIAHEQSEERYFCLERVREGILVRYAKVGGIDIEDHQDQVENMIIQSQNSDLKSQISNDAQFSTDLNIKRLAKYMNIDVVFVNSLMDFFEKNYVSFLEINPLLITKTEKLKLKNLHKIDKGSSRKEIHNIHILDLAVEVDSTARFFIRDGWTEKDIVEDQQRSPEEITIKKLNNNSQAALSFTLLNKDGNIWVLLSGGGASITLADEFYNLGHGKDLGNYGEYSGNPNAEETYLYTKEVLKAIFKSQAKKKILLIGGGVANFTDICVTFSGILHAFEEAKDVMRKHNITVYVRRGGPKEQEGLQMMTEWLKKNRMYGYVAGPEIPLHEIVRKVVKTL